MNREHDFGLKLNILSHKLKKHLNAVLSDLGITGVQSRILHYILVHYSSGAVFQRDIEAVFGLSRSTATGILQLLERDGMIRRESVSTDARLKSLVPTEKAARIDEEVLESITAIERRLVRDISVEEQEIFLSVADRMARNLDN
ncbi:MAG TPA: MarR family transcriptional regulator [Candidatus Pygmaiobacter gallistercoris]|nr:MarR family transcriptional regulator [Candidatus Pygmaiobacter gallistercoris]